MHEERKGKCLRQVEHIRGHLTDRHDIAEILLKAALNTLTLLFVSLLYTMYLCSLVESHFVSYVGC